MRVLVACEFSGRVRDAFTARGHDAWSCDLLPSETPGNHIQDDVLLHIDDGWDLMIAHPPCTYLSRAGAHLWSVRQAAQQTALDFVLALWNSPIARVAIENPIGRLNRMWRYPSQVIQPYMFSDPWSKATCLWLKNLPPLFATNIVAVTPSQPRVAHMSAGRRSGTTYGAFMHANRSAKARSRTFPGVAAAMALQWGVWLGETE